MANTKDFLAAFNDIEEILRNRAKRERGEDTFLGLFKRLEHDRLVGRFKKQLLKLAGLRNILVHHNGPAITEPTDIALETLEKIRQVLTKPPSVLEISSRPLILCTDDTSIKEVVRYMHEKKYTQMPVTHEKHLIGIFSNETLQRWVAEHISDDGLLAVEKLVHDIREHLDPLFPEDFLPRNAEAFIIEKLFSNTATRRINALFVTENGRIDECLLGIITPHDLLKLQEYLVNDKKMVRDDV